MARFSAGYPPRPATATRKGENVSLERIAVLKAEIRGLQTMVDAEITARLKAEAEAAELRAQLDAAYRKAANLELELEKSERQRREVSNMADKMADKWTLQVERLRAELDAARQWRPVTMPLPVTDADIEIVLKARVNDQGLWAFRTMVPVVAWRLDPDAPDDGQEARP